MESTWYRRLFPATRLERFAANELTTTAHGVRMATSVDGVLTGRGADLIIIDDPLKPDEALSDTTRQRVNEWFNSTLVSRLNDKRAGSIVVIMQRLHEDDLTGHLLARGHWDHLSLPAIAEQDEVYEVSSPLLGTRQVGRRAGEALHPGREDLATLERLRQTMGGYNFAGQYQQAPAPCEGGMVKQGWFKSYSPAERPERFGLVLQSWDTANKPTELSEGRALVSPTGAPRPKSVLKSGGHADGVNALPRLSRACPNSGQSPSWPKASSRFGRPGRNAGSL